MIDPTNITNFNRTDAELEEFLLFTIAVAGKKAIPTSKRLDKLLRFGGFSKYNSPFDVIQFLSYKRDLGFLMKDFGFGCWTLKSKGFVEAAYSGLDLKTCTVEDLEKISGIGKKTSRFFVLHSRENAKVACLDTHILRFMRDQGVETPKSTPQSQKLYRSLESQFIIFAENAGKTIADFDLELWNRYSGN